MIEIQPHVYLRILNDAILLFKHYSSHNASWIILNILCKFPLLSALLFLLTPAFHAEVGDMRVDVVSERAVISIGTLLHGITALPITHVFSLKPFINNSLNEQL